VIVLDASVVANAVADDGRAGEVARARLLDAAEASAPDLLDVETVAVLRKRWLVGDLTGARFADAVEELVALPIRRYPAGPLMVRVYELRANLTAYDGAYVALAEGLDCLLVTGDGRPARAPGIGCAVEVLRA
jgi:predicted nucleic acid-binding protein